MAEGSWKPTFRTSGSTLTKVLRSPAFLRARQRSTGIIESPVELRVLADRVESLDRSIAPLSAVADQVGAAVRFFRVKADALEVHASPRSVQTPWPERTAEPAAAPDAPAAAVAARERLLVASLNYLVTPLDLVPDFRAGGYVDDVFLLAWVFGVAANEIAPYLSEDSESWQ